MRPRFLKRILTINEQKQNLTPQRVAGRWAAKESVAKALGIHLKWHDVEVMNSEDGTPMVSFADPSLLPANHTLHLSISHEQGYATAVVILEKHITQAC